MTDLAQMLRDLADAGWVPLLYAETGPGGHVKGFVCYPMALVRFWASFRAPDSVGAVRGLWEHAQAHPNAPPLLWRDGHGLGPAPGESSRCELTAASRAEPSPSPAPAPSGRPFFWQLLARRR